MTDAPDPIAHQPKRDDAAERDVDEIVQHTDSGSGNSQREHWPPNVDQPDPKSEKS